MSETHTITGEQIRAAYDALGLDPELFRETAAIKLAPHLVVAIRYQRNEDGQRYIDPHTNDPAAAATVLDVRWSS